MYLPQLPVFHSFKEGWGLRPILDLQVLNESVMQLKFKILTLRQIMIRTKFWYIVAALVG